MIDDLAVKNQETHLAFMQLPSVNSEGDTLASFAALFFFFPI